MGKGEMGIRQNGKIRRNGNKVKWEKAIWEDTTRYTGSSLHCFVRLYWKNSTRAL
jgi:hypothetical protein